MPFEMKQNIHLLPTKRTAALGRRMCAIKAYAAAKPFIEKS